MVKQEGILMRELTNDALQSVGGGVAGGGSLWSRVKAVALQALASQGPGGALLAAAANAYFD